MHRALLALALLAACDDNRCSFEAATNDYMASSDADSIDSCAEGLQEGFGMSERAWQRARVCAFDHESAQRDFILGWSLIGPEVAHGFAIIGVRHGDRFELAWFDQGRGALTRRACTALVDDGDFYNPNRVGCADDRVVGRCTP